VVFCVFEFILWVFFLLPPPPPPPPPRSYRGMF
jgi:hypothetical protein